MDDDGRFSVADNPVAIHLAEKLSWQNSVVAVLIDFFGSRNESFLTLVKDDLSICDKTLRSDVLRHIDFSRLKYSCFDASSPALQELRAYDRATIWVLQQELTALRDFLTPPAQEQISKPTSADERRAESKGRELLHADVNKLLRSSKLIDSIKESGIPLGTRAARRVSDALSSDFPYIKKGGRPRGVPQGKTPTSENPNTN